MQHIVENGIEDVIFYGPVFSDDKKIYVMYGGSQCNDVIVKTANVNNESIVCHIKTHLKIVSASFLTHNTDIALVLKHDDTGATALILVNTEKKSISPHIFVPGISHVLGYTNMSVFLAIAEKSGSTGAQLASSQFAWEVKYTDCSTDKYTYTKCQISDAQILSDKGFIWSSKHHSLSAKENTMQPTHTNYKAGVTFKHDGVRWVPFLNPISHY
jgi:hypothetical protein